MKSTTIQVPATDGLVSDAGSMLCWEAHACQSAAST
jgi:hypothetical protein